MRPFLAFIFLCGASLLPSNARSADAYVTCVQKGLASFGYAGLPSNGKINSATVAAVEALRGKHPSNHGISVIPKLSEKTAVSWCREISALNPPLRRNMPSGSQPIVLSAGGNGSKQSEMLAQAFREAEQFFQKTYGIYPASRVDVAGSDSGEELAALAVELQRKRGRSYGRMTTYVSRICGTPSNRFGGQAYRDQLLICWPTTENHDNQWRRKTSPIVTSIMIHEFMHHVQRELGNEKFSGRRLSRDRRKLGPAWMVEGTAELAEYRWRVKRGGLPRMSIQKLQKDARESAKSLRAMHGDRTVKGGKQYRIARFAAYLLAERFGEKAIFDYWRYIGQGRTWERSFEMAFGMKLSTYQSQFEAFRVDANKAAAFANLM